MRPERARNTRAGASSPRQPCGPHSLLRNEAAPVATSNSRTAWLEALTRLERSSRVARAPTALVPSSCRQRRRIEFMKVVRSRARSTRISRPNSTLIPQQKVPEPPPSSGALERAPASNDTERSRARRRSKRRERRARLRTHLRSVHASLIARSGRPNPRVGRAACYAVGPGAAP